MTTEYFIRCNFYVIFMLRWFFVENQIILIFIT